MPFVTPNSWLMEGGVDPSFTSLHRLHYVLRGCHRSLPSNVRSKGLPISPAILRLVHRRWSACSNDYDITCLWAACCTGFFGFLCSGEFTCNSWAAYNSSMLSPSDVMIDSRSTPLVVQLTLRRARRTCLEQVSRYTLVVQMTPSAQFQPC